MRRIFFAAVILAIAAGCDTTESRIKQHAAEFAALDAATQQMIKEGVVETGYTADMVEMTLGKPDQILRDPSRAVVWIYHEYPATAYNETIQAGFRRRIVYDPAKRGEDVIVEPIDPKAFPNLYPHTLRFTFRNNRVVAVERTRED